MIGKVQIVLLSQVVVMLLTACQGFMEVVTQAGDDGLVWPLPPTPARLRYDTEIDIQQRLTGSISAITGIQQPVFNAQPWRVAIQKDLFGLVDRQRGTAFLTDRFRNSVIELKYQDDQVAAGIKDIAIDDLKRVYLLDSKRKQVAVFDHNGRTIRQFGSRLMWTDPDRMAIDTVRQRLYVADRFQRRIYVFSLGGVFLYTFGEQGSANTQFGSLTDIAIDQDGNLYVLELTPLRIQQFGTSGNYLKTLDLDKKLFREPVAVAIESGQAIYIADAYRNEIVVLDLQGRPIMELGGLGRRRGRFSGLTDIDFDSSWKRLVSAEVTMSRLQVFRRTAETWMPYP